MLSNEWNTHRILDSYNFREILLLKQIVISNNLFLLDEKYCDVQKNVYNELNWPAADKLFRYLEIINSDEHGINRTLLLDLWQSTNVKYY